MFRWVRIDIFFSFFLCDITKILVYLGKNMLSVRVVYTILFENFA